MKKVLVTGAGRGIGKEIALMLLKRGDCKVALCSRTTKELDAIVRRYPKRAVAIPGDVSMPNDCTRIADVAALAMKGLDGVVQSAGIIRYAATGEIRADDFDALFRTNLMGPALLAQAAAKHLKKNRAGGSIINISSSLALRTAPRTLAYSAVKAGLLSATETLAQELAPHKIRVNAIAPGVVDTSMIRRNRSAAEIKMLTELHPLKRLGRPGEIASLAVWLLDSEWVTGSTFVIDGGLIVRA